MVKLHVKKSDESVFLYETTTSVLLDDLVREIVSIYNGRLKIQRICLEMLELAKYGCSLPQEMQGLSKEQFISKTESNVSELVDQLTSELSIEDYIVSEDPSLRRNGKAPPKNMSEILTRAAAEATSAISTESVPADLCLTMDIIRDSLALLQKSIGVVYPQGLPKHDPICCELESRENLKGTDAEKHVMNVDTAQLWWAGKELQRDKKLSDFVGINEKTKLIVKLQKVGYGPPCRESVVTEEQQKELMLLAYRRQQELQHLEEDSDDSYLNSSWADQKTWKRSFHGVENIRWK